MSELLFLKLGGSLLTDKTQPQTLRHEVLTRVAAEIATAVRKRADLAMVLGHGSGSFGHVAASKYRTRAGVRSSGEWRGYAETAVAAARLNHLVIDALSQAELPVLPVQPSASARCRDGELVALDTRPIVSALEHGLVPVIYGDVCLDDIRGGTIISTEQIFRRLAGQLSPQRIVLAGEVPGVLSADPASGKNAELLPEINPAVFSGLQSSTFGGSRGVDVTGGMLAKVTEMLALIQEVPSLEFVQIVSGLVPGVVQAALIDPAHAPGTRLRR